MEHLTQQQLEDYSLNRLGAAELVSVSDHLGECEVCRGLVEAGMNGDAAFFALHEEAFTDDAGGLSAHLSAGQTAEYVDKNLSGESLQMVTDHLAGCEQCVLAVADLRAFRNEIAPSLDREYGPATAPVASSSVSWRTKFASLFRGSPVPAFGSAALAVLLLAMVAWLVWRRPAERQPEVAVMPTPIAQPSPSVELPSVSPQPEPASVAQLNDGNRVLALDEQGNLSGADDLPAAYKTLVTKALSTQRIERSSQLQGLTRPGSTLMSSDNQKDQFSVVQPVGDVLIINNPTFRWTALDGATGYVVEIYDEQFKLVASSPQLTEALWTTSLPRGHVYSWQVKALKEGQEITSPRPPAPQAKFRVLDQGKVNEIQRARRAYGSSHLTLALLYADAGLLKEAEQELRLLRRANPNSDLPAKLLRQVQAMRR